VVQPWPAEFSVRSSRRRRGAWQGVFVVAATAWLDPDEQGQIMADTVAR